MSSKLNKIANRGKSTFTQVEEKNAKFRRGLRKTSTQAKKTKSSLGGLNGILTKIGIGFGIFEAGRAVGGVITMGAEMEQTRISFETMLGSVDKATETIKKLDKFSNVTPFTNDEVIKSGRNLIAFGVENEKLIPTLKKIGDVSAGLKIPFNELSGIYGKIKVQNTVYGEDLNRLAGRGIPVFTELSKAMGVNQEDIKKLASQGKIKFADIEQAFTNMTKEGGTFFDLMSKQSKSFGGKWSTLMGKIQLAATKLGERLLPILKPFVTWTIAVVDNLPKIVGFFRSLYTTVADNAIVFGLLTTAFLALNAQMIISKISLVAFVLQYKGYLIWTKLATIAQWNLNAAFAANPIGITIGLIAALVAGIVYAYNKFGWFRGSLYAIWETMKGFGGALKELVVDRIKDMIRGVTGLGKALMQFFQGDWKKAWETGKQATADLVGVNSGAKFLGKMKGVGQDAAGAYLDGINEVKNEENGKALMESFLNPKKSSITGLSVNDILNGKFGAFGKSKDGDTEKDIKDNGDGTGMPEGLGKGIDTITGGGSKKTNINVTFGKLVENFNLNSQTVKEGFTQSEDELKRMLLRVLNSANQMQTSPA